MAIESIAKTLGTGSGIDTASLVTSLVEAQFAAKSAQLKKKSENLTAQVSAASTAKSNITTFSSALLTLVKGGTLSTQPTSSDESVAKVSLISGANISGVNGRIEVRSLAAGQTSSSAALPSTQTFGTGTLTFAFGTADVNATTHVMDGFTPTVPASTFDVTITSANNTLEGIRDAINTANHGISASILTDADGSRLVLKGPNGAAQAFTMTATETVGEEGLAALDVGTGSTIANTATDANVVVDGVSVKRTSNSISDLIQGIKLDLIDAKPGTVIRIGSTEPTTALTNAVNDIVDTYNEVFGALAKDLNAVDGALRADPAAKTLQRSLARITTTTLVSNAPDGAPRTLADIGVTTNRDGTLSLDTTKLSKALISHADVVESMFAQPVGAATTGNGISALMTAISTAASSTATGLGASTSRYTSQQSDIAKQQAKITERSEAVKTRMTQQFAAMDAKVAAYKSTQTFLENQIKAWNSSDN